MQFQDYGHFQNDNSIQINIVIKSISNTSTNEPLIITVNRFDTIYTLNQIINSQLNDGNEQTVKKYVFFYNGINLNTNSVFSLAFYGIKNNDTLTLYEQNMPESDILYNHETSHHLQFSNFYRGQEKQLEQGRIRDILLSRIEGTSTCFRKNVFRFEQMVTNDTKLNNKHSRTVVEDSQDAPSTHMLPQVWSGENTIYPKN